MYIIYAADIMIPFEQGSQKVAKDTKYYTSYLNKNLTLFIQQRIFLIKTLNYVIFLASYVRLYRG